MIFHLRNHSNCISIPNFILKIKTYMHVMLIEYPRMFVLADIWCHMNFVKKKYNDNIDGNTGLIFQYSIKIKRQ